MHFNKQAASSPHGRIAQALAPLLDAEVQTGPAICTSRKHRRSSPPQPTTVMGVAALLLLAIAVRVHTAGWARADEATTLWFVPDDLSNTSSCDSLGMERVDTYRAVLRVNDSYATGASEDVFFPLFSSHPLPGPAPDSDLEADPAVRVGMIFVHGALRNANAYFCEGSSAVASRGGDVKARTLVVAPWYGTEQLSAEEWMGRGNGTSTRWTNNSWIQGGVRGTHTPTRKRCCNASHLPCANAGICRQKRLARCTPQDTRGKPKRFSTSFDIMDQLVRLLLDGAPLVDGAKLYPRLDHVVIVGFSAGAQEPGVNGGSHAETSPAHQLRTPPRSSSRSATPSSPRLTPACATCSPMPQRGCTFHPSARRPAARCSTTRECLMPASSSASQTLRSALAITTTSTFPLLSPLCAPMAMPVAVFTVLSTPLG